MNPYAVVILVALTSEFLLSIISNLLNLRASRRQPPKDLEGLYDKQEYRKSQDYMRESTRLDLVSRAVNLSALLIFWNIGGFNALDVRIRALGLGEIWTGLIYIGTLLLAMGLLSLPFSAYSTFGIESRYGFNRSSVRTFGGDIAKGIALAIGIGGPLTAGILALFEFAGPAAWVYCWIMASLWTLFVQLVAPTWILPLFNRFEPLEAGELRQELEKFAEKARFPLESIFVMDGSKRSTRANAFFTGFGKRRRVVLFDTLVENHSPRELTAILAHEIGHFKKRHIMKGTIVSIAHVGALLWLLSVFLTHDGLFQAFALQEPSTYTGLIIFGLLFTPVEFFLSVAMSLFSRRYEFEADQFALESTGSAKDLISALKTLARKNLTNLTPHPLYVFLNYSHPPLLQRIRALQDPGSAF